METKLKALKVVDLRAILAKSNVSFPTRATKQDLIARIVDSPTAIQVYHQLHADVLSSPELDNSTKSQSSARVSFLDFLLIHLTISPRLSQPSSLLNPFNRHPLTRPPLHFLFPRIRRRRGASNVLPVSGSQSLTHTSLILPPEMECLKNIYLTCVVSPRHTMVSLLIKI